MKRNVFTPLLLVVAFVLTVGLACGFNLGSAPQTQPTQPSVPLPVQPTSPLPQPTEIPPTVPVASTRFFKEDFNGNADNWSPFVTRGEQGNLELSVSGGFYVFKLLKTQVWGYSIYTPEVYEDVRLDVVAENRGDNENNVTLVCRYSKEEGWYEVSIANNGLYWIYYGKWDSSGKTASYAVIADGGSNNIRQGKDVNTYSLVCQGHALTVFINGEQIRSVNDNQFVLREGNIGVGVASFRRLPVEVQFDSVEISEP